ncbi:MAG: cation:proton antiporter, partial [Burkholderiaceae bacterium]|nr:cation:proton antiporter [Burkholderiaceae bacterium]
PETFAAVFRATDGMAVSVISQLGLILLMVHVGMESEFGLLRERASGRAAALVAAAGIAVPFALGLAIGAASAPALAAGIEPLSYTLFCGVALSITALPILGRILLEFDLTRTRIGAITVTAAAANDVAGWVLLATIAAAVTGGLTFSGFAARLAALAALAALAFWLVRPLLRTALARTTSAAEPLTGNALAIVLIAAFAASIATYQIGIFALFGGFLVGMLLHDRRALVAAWRERVSPLVTTLLLPVFFTFTGLRTDVQGLASAELWLWCAAFIALAYLGKFGGCYLGARLAGVGADEARAIAILMNTRGLMELVVLNVGYDLGVIPQSVFTMLVLMALATTLTTAPFLRLWLARLGHVIPRQRDA